MNTSWDWLWRIIARSARIRKPRQRCAVRTASLFRSDEPGTLANTGLCCLNGPAGAIAEKTVIVVGVARGGTSMIAGALDRLGIHMGEAVPPLYEDRSLGALIEKRDHRQAARIIAERNRAHATWGFKHPSRLILSRRWRGLFRAPVYVFVFRDPLAIANRRAVSREKDLLGEMSVALEQYRGITRFLHAGNRPALLVSYEKALINPLEFAEQLAAFLGISDSERISAACRFVQPSPKDYHSVARHRADWAGYLDLVRPHEVAGWAFRTGSAAPVTVRLTINGQPAQLAIADLPRPDVRQHFRHVTDRCGFTFQIDPGRALQPGDLVSVGLQGLSEDINNSPQRCP